MPQYTDRVARCRETIAEEIEYTVASAIDDSPSPISDRQITDEHLVWEIIDDRFIVEAVADLLRADGWRVLVADCYGKLSIIVS